MYEPVAFRGIFIFKICLYITIIFDEFLNFEYLLIL